MASSTRLLLRLPPCLRQQFLAAPVVPEPLARLNINGREVLSSSIRLQTRSFGLSCRLAKSAERARPSRLPRTSTKQPPAPKAMINKSLPPAPRPSQTNPNSPPVRVLLYASPAHGAFFVTSYLSGGFLLLGAFSYAEMFLKERPDGAKTPFGVKLLGGFATVMIAAFATVFVMAPTRMIKSISCVAPGALVTTHAPRTIRFEIKRWLPFLKPKVLHISPHEVLLDRNVPTLLEDIKFFNIRNTEAQSFTESYFSAEQRRKSAKGVVSAISQSLLNTWPATTREVRRIFLRDQMAYMEIQGKYRCKLDLQGCFLLDNGDPLHRVIAADTEARPSISRWMRQIFSG